MSVPPNVKQDINRASLLHQFWFMFIIYICACVCVYACIFQKEEAAMYIYYIDMVYLSVAYLFQIQSLLLHEISSLYLIMALWHQVCTNSTDLPHQIHIICWSQTPILPRYLLLILEMIPKHFWQQSCINCFDDNFIYNNL